MCMCEAWCVCVCVRLGVCVCVCVCVCGCWFESNWTRVSVSFGRGGGPAFDSVLLSREYVGKRYQLSF